VSQQQIGGPTVERRGASGPTLSKYLFGYLAGCVRRCSGAGGLGGGGVPGRAVKAARSATEGGRRRTRRLRVLTRAECPKPSEPQVSRASSARPPCREHRSEPPAQQGAPPGPTRGTPAGEAAPATDDYRLPGTPREHPEKKPTPRQSLRWTRAGSCRRTWVRRSREASARATPSPSSTQASTSPQGSITTLWPNVRRPFSCRPPWAGATT